MSRCFDIWDLWPSGTVFHSMTCPLLLGTVSNKLSFHWQLSPDLLALLYLSLTIFINTLYFKIRVKSSRTLFQMGWSGKPLWGRSICKNQNKLNEPYWPWRKNVPCSRNHKGKGPEVEHIYFQGKPGLNPYLVASEMGRQTLLFQKSLCL